MRDHDKIYSPCDKSILARELIEKHNLTQVSAAEKLELTQSAISRYLTSDRGNRVQLSNEVARSMETIANDLASRNSSPTLTIEETCRICLFMRRSGDFCGIHRELERGIPDSCDACIKVLAVKTLHA